MTDEPADHGAGASQAGAPSSGVERAALRHPFPFVRLLYAAAFAFLAWLVFWFVVILAALQFITRAVMGYSNEELRQFSRNLIAYMQELLGYVSFIRDERPFPFGPFPKG